MFHLFNIDSEDYNGEEVANSCIHKVDWDSLITKTLPDEEYSVKVIYNDSMERITTTIPFDVLKKGLLDSVNNIAFEVKGGYLYYKKKEPSHYWFEKIYTFKVHDWDFESVAPPQDYAHATINGYECIQGSATPLHGKLGCISKLDMALVNKWFKENKNHMNMKEISDNGYVTFEGSTSHMRAYVKNWYDVDGKFLDTKAVMYHLPWDEHAVDILSLEYGLYPFTAEKSVRNSLKYYSKEYTKNNTHWYEKPKEYLVFCNHDTELVIKSKMSYLNMMDILTKSIPGEFRVDNDHGRHYYIDGKLVESRLYDDYIDECSMKILNWDLSESPTIIIKEGDYDSTYIYALILLGGNKYIVSASINEHVPPRSIDGVPFLNYYSASDELANMWLEEVGKEMGFESVKLFAFRAIHKDGSKSYFRQKSEDNIYNPDGTLVAMEELFYIH